MKTNCGRAMPKTRQQPQTRIPYAQIENPSAKQTIEAILVVEETWQMATDGSIVIEEAWTATEVDDA